MVNLANLVEALPVYVTRKDANGQTTTYSMSIWVTLFVMIVVGLNIIVWGLIALYEAILFVI